VRNPSGEAKRGREQFKKLASALNPKKKDGKLLKPIFPARQRSSTVGALPLQGRGKKLNQNGLDTPS